MSQLESVMGYQFKNSELLQQALTHRSFDNEFKNLSTGHNERLEFLGDAVLDLAISEWLMANFADDTEGDLSKKRASLVNETTLAELSLELGVAEEVRLGKGESQTGGRVRPRLIASALEAVIGALFVDGGYQVTADFIVKIFDKKLTLIKVEIDYSTDYKTKYQELAQKKYRLTPTYELLREDGPPHDRQFTVVVKVGSAVIAEGLGHSKKEAEQNAAKRAMEVERE